MYAIIFTFVVKEKVDSLKWEAINKFIFSLTGLIFSFLLVFLVFANRGSSLEKTDRYMFMSVFFQETQDWNFFQYMTGAPSITPLSNDAVNSVSWLNELFSHSEDGSCYSVVLHSYILRVLFDHGIIGMICIIFFTYEILKLSHINKKIIWVTISIFMLNGLSVSSFNSVFFPVSMIFLMGTQYEKIHLKWN
jgi:hypothetical protein